MCSIDSGGSVYIKLLDRLRRPFFSVSVLIVFVLSIEAVVVEVGLQAGEEKRMPRVG